MQMLLRFAAGLLPALTLAACAPSAVAPDTQGPANTATEHDPASVHARTLTLDTHLDTPIHFERAGWNFGEQHSFATDLSHVDIPRMREGGLDGGFFVLYTPQGPLTDAGYAAAATAANRRLTAMERTMADNRRAIIQVTTPRQITDAKARGQLFALFSVENSYPLGNSVAGLAEWRRRGVMMAGPTHNGGNQFADSASGGEKRWHGLSPLGREWVAEMNRLGMVIDASHASDETLAQMLELSQAPIVLSHSGLKAIFNHPRNITDDQLRALAAKGGVLQINSVFLSRFNNSAARAPLYEQFDHISQLTPEQVRTVARQWQELDQRERVNEGNFDLFMRALKHCLDIAGPRHCGIGADWDGGGGLAGFEDITALPKVTAALMEAGYSEADIAQIWGGNVLRVMQEVEAVRARLAARETGTATVQWFPKATLARAPEPA